MPLEREQFPPAGRLPHLGRLIPTAGDNPLAVRGKGHRTNPIAVPLERKQFLAAGRLPHLGRLILTAGDNPLAVRGKGHRPNLIAVPLERDSSRPLAASHTLAVSSSLPVTIRWPSGEKAQSKSHHCAP